MAGVGKTTLAREFSRRAVCRGYYRQGVFWLNGTNCTTMAASVKDLLVGGTVFHSKLFAHQWGKAEVEEGPGPFEI